MKNLRYTTIGIKTREDNTSLPMILKHIRQNCVDIFVQVKIILLLISSILKEQIKTKQLITSIVFRDNRCPPPPTPTHMLKFDLFSSAVTLKNRSRSPKSNQSLHNAPLSYHANLVQICPQLHVVSCIKESVTPMWMESALKLMSPSSLKGGGGIILLVIEWSFL